MHFATKPIQPPRNTLTPLLALALCGALASAAIAQNDNFADRDQIVGGAASVLCDNASATAEVGEPHHVPGHAPTASVWWEWVAPQDGHVEVNTEGTLFDTFLAVYVGDNLVSLENRGRNDDTYTLGSQSRVIFYAEKDETYVFAVDGKDGAGGEITLNLFPALLRNDEFGQRIPVEGESVYDVQSNVGGTVGLFEPNHIEPLNSSASIWWEWTCHADGWITVDTKGSSFDTVSAVYIQNVILIANNNNYYRGGDGDLELHPFDVSDEFNAFLRFYATAGNSYQIVVDGADGLEEGEVQLSITQSQDHPPNDNVTAAEILVPVADGDQLTASASGTNYNASVELGEPDHNPGDETSASATVWYQWQSPAVDRLVSIDTFASDFDTILAVYSREGSNLVRWATNDDHDNADEFQSGVTFNSKAGTVYLIAVDGYSGEQGQIGLNLTAGNQENDNVEKAVVQFGFDWQSSSDSAIATAQTGEPDHLPGAPPSKSMWWRWDAPLDGDVRIDTLASDFDTVIAVYTGIDQFNGQPFSGPDLTLVGSNDDAPGAAAGQSSVQIPVEFGQTYFIVVDGKSGASGNVSLRFSTLGGFSHWLSQFPNLLALLELPQDDPARVGALPDGDPDNDGFSNRLEAAFGLHPEINSQPQGTDPNRSNAPQYTFDGTKVIIDFDLDPLFAQANDNSDSTRLRVQAERSFNGTIWSTLSAQHVTGNQYRVTFPVANGQDFGLFRVTAHDSELAE